jgi:peptidoglycan hydrolase-like protein with peptidoglycan-binding domain
MARSWKVLRQGDAKAVVNAEQDLLRMAGHWGMWRPGSYDKHMANAVRVFQAVQGVKADGVLCPGTWLKLVPLVRDPAPGARCAGRAAAACCEDDGPVGPSPVFDQATADRVVAFRTKLSLGTAPEFDKVTWCHGEQRPAHVVLSEGRPG